MCQYTCLAGIGGSDELQIELRDISGYAGGSTVDSTALAYYDNIVIYRHATAAAAAVGGAATYILTVSIHRVIFCLQTSLHVWPLCWPGDLQPPP